MPLRAPIRVPTYTTDDLRRFPRDGQRYELLNGFLLVTPAPGTAHQVVLSRLMAALLAYLPEGAPARVTSPGEIEVAPHDHRVLVSSRGARPDVPHLDELIWHPSEMPAPLTIDLRTLFAGLD
jgi:Uma2 family endonuclease